MRSTCDIHIHTAAARSLSDAAHELHSFAVWLVELEREGWQLIHDAELHDA